MKGDEQVSKEKVLDEETKSPVIKGKGARKASF